MTVLPASDASNMSLFSSCTNDETCWVQKASHASHRHRKKERTRYVTAVLILLRVKKASTYFITFFFFVADVQFASAMCGIDVYHFCFDFCFVPYCRYSSTPKESQRDQLLRSPCSVDRLLGTIRCELTRRKQLESSRDKNEGAYRIGERGEESAQ